MTQLGLWKIMHHPSHHHPNHLRQHGAQCDDAEFVKAPAKQKELKLPFGDIPVEGLPAKLSTDQLATNGNAVVAEVKSAAVSPRETKKNVNFSTIHIREYELIVGDNPDCSFPLSLGWRFIEDETMDLDFYERHHKPKRLQGRIEDSVHVGQLLGVTLPLIDPLMTTTMRPLTLYERRLLLRAQGHSEQNLRKAERKRRVELSLQWASGHYPKQEAFPYSQRFYLNYVL